MSRLHCILTPVGSAGDVHPFIGIGRRLRQRGHDVTIVTSEAFQEPCERAGLDFVGTWTKAEFESVIRKPDLWHPRRGLKLVLRTTCEHLQPMYDKIASVYEPSRSMIVGHSLSFAARVFEEKHEAPAATVHLAPSVFRSDFEQPVLVPGRDLSGWPRWIKRTLWWLVDKLFVDPHIVPAMSKWRAGFGLAPIRRPFKQWMHSPQGVIGLFPDWFGPPQPDWPQPLHLTGFPLFDEAGHHELDPRLESFLNEGPPIVFTPGSANMHARKFFRAAIDASALLRRRALLLTKYREQLPADLPGHVLHMPYVPFSEVTPRCAAFVHHGGIGTCAQGLAAGVPQLIMPLGFDQPDNAMRLKRLGVGAWVVPRRFKGKRVAAALRELLDSPLVGEAAKQCARRIDGNDSLDRTCDAIEQIAAAKLRSSSLAASATSAPEATAAPAPPR